MSPNIITTAADVRSRYGSLFQSVAEVARIRYGDRPSTMFEEIKETTKRLSDDDFLSDYLTENLGRLYSLYSEMLPGKKHEQKWLDDLYAMLSIVISDLVEEISELIDEANRHDSEMLWKRLNGCTGPRTAWSAAARWRMGSACPVGTTAILMAICPSEADIRKRRRAKASSTF